MEWTTNRWLAVFLFFMTGCNAIAFFVAKSEVPAAVNFAAVFINIAIGLYHLSRIKPQQRLIHEAQADLWRAAGPPPVEANPYASPAIQQWPPLTE